MKAVLVPDSNAFLAMLGERMNSVVDGFEQLGNPKSWKELEETLDTAFGQWLEELPASSQQGYNWDFAKHFVQYARDAGWSAEDVYEFLTRMRGESVVWSVETIRLRNAFFRLITRCRWKNQPVKLVQLSHTVPFLKVALL